MYTIGDPVQITNHSEPECNGMYGNVMRVTMAYDGTVYLTVLLENGNVCDCTHDELMEG